MDCVSARRRSLDRAELGRDWIQAANHGRDFAKAGKKIPAADLQIAAVALRLNCAVYTTDPHFDSFPDLLRFDPD